MPKINTKVAETQPDLSEDGEYEVVTVESMKTIQNNWPAIRIACKDAEGIEFVAMAWLPKDMSQGTADYSKLGAFMSKMGDDTDSWVGKKFRVDEWKAKHNEIAIIEDFTSKKPKKPSKKDAE